jgi:hypothetical protein
MDYAKALDALDNPPLGLTADGLMAQMREPWPGMEDDVRLAKSILFKHAIAAQENGTSLPVIGTLGLDGHSLLVADWIWEILDTFSKRYPGDEGAFRYRKAMFFIQDRMLPHSELDGDIQVLPLSVFDI